MSFDRLGLSPELLRAVANQGYTEPTPSRPRPSRSSSPAATCSPAPRPAPARRPPSSCRCSSASTPRDRRASAVIRALILAPTRELALQVEESVRTYGAQNPIRSTTIYGGVGFDPQVRALRAGPEIVVATPGRLLDHLGQRTIDLSHVEILVLDEADRMLDMGFIRDIRKILAVLPPRRQNLLFSATFSDEIRRLADGLLDDPASVQVSPRNTATELVTQVVHPVDRERKRELLSHLIKTGRIDQALVFTRTKHGANRLATQLEHDGILATAIHGNKSQPQRVRALADFKAGRFAGPRRDRGRGPRASTSTRCRTSSTSSCRWSPRTTSTGSAAPGAPASTATPSRSSASTRLRLLRDIEQVLGHAIPSEVIEGFEPDPRIRPEPILRGGLGGARSMGGQRPKKGPSNGGPASTAAGRPPAPAASYPRPPAPRAPPPPAEYRQKSARSRDAPSQTNQTGQQAQNRPTTGGGRRPTRLARAIRSVRLRTDKPCRASDSHASAVATAADPGRAHRSSW